MKETGVIFFNLSQTTRGKLTMQQIKNEYYYMMLEEINEYLVKWNKTFEWKLKQVQRLESICGAPVKLSRWQNFFANYLMM